MHTLDTEPGENRRRFGGVRTRLAVLGVAALTATVGIGVALARPEGTAVVADASAPEAPPAQPEPTAAVPTVTATTAAPLPTPAADGTYPSPFSADPLYTMYGHCLRSNGSTTSFDTEPTPAQKDAWRKADAACAEFASPVFVSRTDRFTTCAAANGVGDPPGRQPWDVHAPPREDAARAWKACRELHPGLTDGPPGYEAYVECHAERGVFFLWFGAAEGVDEAAASAACAPLATWDQPVPLAPEEQPFYDCIASFGIDIRTRMELSPEVAGPAWAACGALFERRRALPIDLCLEEQGIVTFWQVEYPLETLVAAERACAALVQGPRTQFPDKQRWLDCLAAQGIQLPIWRASVPVPVALARAASDACRSIRPAKLAAMDCYHCEQTLSLAYDACRADNAFAWFPVPVTGVDLEEAEGACRSLAPPMPVLEATFRWHRCLADNGFALPTDGAAPALSASAQAVVACDPLRPADT